MAAKVPAVAYLRTSSAANVGADKDSAKRQRDAIRRFAQSQGYELVHEVYDAAVSGADPIEGRPGFSTLLDYVEANQVAVVMVEDASRLARSLLAQEVGIVSLAGRGLRVLTASGENLTETEDETKILWRQMMGAFAEHEKRRLVKKLRLARDRQSASLGRRIEGRRSHAERDPELHRHAKRLARRNRVTGKRRSLREIAIELEALDFRTAKGNRFSPSQVQRLIDAQPRPPKAA